MGFWTSSPLYKHTFIQTRTYGKGKTRLWETVTERVKHLDPNAGDRSCYSEVAIQEPNSTKTAGGETWVKTIRGINKRTGEEQGRADEADEEHVGRKEHCWRPGE